MKLPHLLMIDDSRTDASIIERIVNKYPANWAFTWFEDSEKALAHLCEKNAPPYSLMLLDIKMPRLTGLELLAELKGRVDFTEVADRIVVFSSSSMPSDLDFVANYNGVAYKTKPNGYLEAKTWLNQLLSDYSDYSDKL